MNKEVIRHHILHQLRVECDNATRSATAAHEAATNEESKAENKYDTRGLEASYLAEGQSRRVLELEQAIALYEKLEIVEFTEQTPIRLTALVTLEDHQSQSKCLFIGPVSGGLKVAIDELECMVVTPQSPLGSSLLGKRVDDEVSINTAGRSVHYDIVKVI